MASEGVVAGVELCLFKKKKKEVEEKMQKNGDKNIDTSDQKVANSRFDWAVGCCSCGCDSCGSLPPTFDCDTEARCLVVTL